MSLDDTSDEFFFNLLDPDRNQSLKYGDGLTEEQIPEAIKLVDLYLRASFEHFIDKDKSQRLRALRDIAKKNLVDYLSKPNRKNDPDEE